MTKAEHILTKLSQAAPPDPTVAKPAAAPATPTSGAATPPPVQKPPADAGKVQAPPAAKAAGNTQTTKPNTGGVNKTTNKDGSVTFTGKDGQTHTYTPGEKRGPVQIQSKTTMNRSSIDGKDSKDYSKNIKMTDKTTGKETVYNQREKNNISKKVFNTKTKDGVETKSTSMKGYKGNIFDPKGKKTLTTSTDASGKTTSTYGGRKLLLPGRAKRMQARWTKAQEKTSGDNNMNKEAFLGGTIKALRRLAPAILRGGKATAQVGSRAAAKAVAPLAKGYQAGMGAIGRAALRQSALPIKGLGIKGKRMVDTGFGKSVHTIPRGGWGGPRWTAKDLVLPGLLGYGAKKGLDAVREHSTTKSRLNRSRNANERAYLQGVHDATQQKYDVTAGDTLDQISRDYGTTPKDIMDINPSITDPNLIQAGQELVLPPMFKGGEYSKADTVLTKISQQWRGGGYNDKDILARTKLPGWKTKTTVDGPMTYSTGYDDSGFRSDTLRTDLGAALGYPGHNIHTQIRHTKPKLPDGGSHWIDDTGAKGKDGDWEGANVEQYLNTDQGTFSKDYNQYIGTGAQHRDLAKRFPTIEQIDKAHEEISNANKKSKTKLEKKGEYGMRTDKEKIIANAFINEIREQGGLQKVAWTWKGVGQTLSNWGGKVHDYAVGPALDVLGMIPAVGNVADLANAGIYAARGQAGNAALSATAAIPGVGWGATAAKWGNKAVKAGKGATKTVPTIIKQTKKIKDLKAPGKIISKITPFRNAKAGLTGFRQVGANTAVDVSKKIVDKFPGFAGVSKRLSTIPGGGLGLRNPITNKILKYPVAGAKIWAHGERPITTAISAATGSEVDKTPFRTAGQGIKDLAGMGANLGGYYSKDQLAAGLKADPEAFGLPKHIGNENAWNGSTFDANWTPEGAANTNSANNSATGNTSGSSSNTGYTNSALEKVRQQNKK